MNESEAMEVDAMQCDFCNMRGFQEREGYYYCIECGTKKEQLRAVEISAEDTFNDTAKHTTQRTIKQKTKVKTEDNDITSWEFYNYVLRGFLQELIHMGAKPELKLMTLQVWAAYLGRMEVAFCNNELGLPKLNVRVLERDARIIYNHKLNKRKRDRQLKNVSQQLEGDERSNWREWRKTKRKLDESDFGQKKKGALSESTLQGNVSLKLQWSNNARRSLKQQMPLKHLDKHSVDSEGSMHCHRLHPKAGTLNSFDRNIYCLNITKLYVVLAIALNLVEDDINLLDLLRFIDEEHLTSRYLFQYLPDNVAVQGKTLLKQMEFGHQMDKCRYKFIRQQIAQMSRFIDLNGFQKPNLATLAERYVLELNLPPQLASYVTSLMEVLPPAFEPIHGQHSYPRYEARVMAYIIYVLKLLFGLDDVKERAISDSAKVINEQLLEQTQMAPLFVYTEWMQFVEMRKIYVAHYSESFARRCHVATPNGRKVNDFLNKERKQREQEYNYKDMLLTPAMQRQQENLGLIFETLLAKEFGDQSTSKDHIEFQPSLTPAHSYFKRILLHASQGELSVQIPDYLHVDHTARQLGPFKNQTTELAQYLSLNKQLQLRVEELNCRAEYQQVGIFQSLRTEKLHKERRANFEIKTSDWIAELRREKRQNFEFRQPVANYGKQYRNKIMERAKRRQDLERDNPFWQISNTATPTYLLKLNNEEIPLNNLLGIQTFDETNMEPLRVPLDWPRRPKETVAIEPKVEPEQQQKSKAEQEQEKESELLLKISSFDCWLLHGYITAIHSTAKQKLRSLFPCSFRWLLDTCASTIGVDWEILYEQLLVIEVMFHHGIEDWNNHSNHLRLKYNTLNKDISLLTKAFRDMW